MGSEREEEGDPIKNGEGCGDGDGGVDYGVWRCELKAMGSRVGVTCL